MILKIIQYIIHNVFSKPFRPRVYDDFLYRYVSEAFQYFRFSSFRFYLQEINMVYFQQFANVFYSIDTHVYDFS